ncbi:MAG: hypothetical protein V1760_02320 [Candidatus Peregrinibacteria bacterium]
MSNRLPPDKQSIAGMSDEEVERLPESFAIEYINGGKLQDYLRQMGAVFMSGGAMGENNEKVYAEGKLPDGTLVKIEATKGKNYQTPQEIAREIREKFKKQKKE